MPTRPPVFGKRSGAAPRFKPKLANNSDKRLRGRAGVKERAAILAIEPTCRSCRTKGRMVRADVVDHIMPLSWGGDDTRANKQPLCHDCHDAKSAREQAVRGTGAASHPEWLRLSAVPLTIVCGPPCSGKTTWVERSAAKGDRVIDLDTIRRELDPTYRHWSGPVDEELLQRSLRYRNHLLGRLARPNGSPAWFIVAAPTEAEREWWQDSLGGELELLDPGRDECERRAMRRGTPMAVDGIAAWYEAAELPWTRGGG